MLDPLEEGLTPDGLLAWHRLAEEYDHVAEAWNDALIAVAVELEGGRYAAGFRCQLRSSDSPTRSGAGTPRRHGHDRAERQRDGQHEADPLDGRLPRSATTRRTGGSRGLPSSATRPKLWAGHHPAGEEGS